MPYFSSVSDEWNRDLKTTKEIPVMFKCRNSVHVEDLQEILLAGNLPKCRSVCHALSGVPKERKSIPQRPPGRLVPIPPAIAPFHRIEIDLLGRFPKSAHGNKWIIVCTDYSTRYEITKALSTADEIAKFLLEEIVLRHGAPRVIIIDRGAFFRSRLVSSLVDLCNIDHRFTTAYHPQTNGLTESFNKTLADMLSMYVDAEQKNWDEILPFEMAMMFFNIQKLKLAEKPTKNMYDDAVVGFRMVSEKQNAVSTAY
ncbi:transposon Ty3-I Gag-Pol polyprotein [Trichonephila inaurata madagascariensis]|uniref:Transposon Ty3-I Gag-Pol polyprotein n=1 Tax=Trichonephila inaurata madagascariensis TaxID=2747483 RepID=A0A8X6MGC2_9ARAC|nr:transposon Ty3-I Gag-Pol polyprotein [Trichonephila inaurata madagascariensis]